MLLWRTLLWSSLFEKESFSCSCTGVGKLRIDMCKQRVGSVLSTSCIAGIVCPHSMQVYSSDVSAQDEIPYFLLTPFLQVFLSHDHRPHLYILSSPSIVVLFLAVFSSSLHPTFISPSADNTTPNYYASSAKLVICSPVAHAPPRFIHTCLLSPTAEDLLRCLSWTSGFALRGGSLIR